MRLVLLTSQGQKARLGLCNFLKSSILKILLKRAFLSATSLLEALQVESIKELKELKKVTLNWNNYNF